MNREQLIDLFASLGAQDPELWAASQIDEGIPQLHRFVFLRQAWEAVLARDNTAWIENLQRAATPDDTQAADALARLLAAGAGSGDLTLVARHMQRELLFALCYLLDDPGGIEPEVEGVGWGLFAIGSDGQASGQIQMLHESVLETDPETDRTAAS